VVVTAGDTDWLPLVALVPVQPLLAVQEVALVELQLSVAAAPVVMLVGEAASVTMVVGGGGVTVPRGMIPQFGVLLNPLFNTVNQLLAPVRRAHDAAAPGAP